MNRKGMIDKLIKHIEKIDGIDGSNISLGASDIMLPKINDIRAAIAREAASGYSQSTMSSLMMGMTNVLKAVTAAIVAPSIESEDSLRALTTDAVYDIMPRIMREVDKDMSISSDYLISATSWQYLTRIDPLPLSGIMLTPVSAMLVPDNEDATFEHSGMTIPQKALGELQRLMMVGAMRLISKATASRSLEFARAYSSVGDSRNHSDILESAKNPELTHTADVLVQGLTRARLMVDFVEDILSKINPDRSNAPWPYDQEMEVISALETLRNSLSYARRTIGEDNMIMSLVAKSWLFIYMQWPDTLTTHPNFINNYWWFNPTREYVEKQMPLQSALTIDAMYDKTKSLTSTYKPWISSGLAYDAEAEGLQEVMKASAAAMLFASNAILWATLGSAWGLIGAAGACSSRTYLSSCWHLLSSSLLSAPHFDREAFLKMRADGTLTNDGMLMALSFILPKIISNISGPYAETSAVSGNTTCCKDAAMLLSASSRLQSAFSGLVCPNLSDETIRAAVGYAKNMEIDFWPFLRTTFGLDGDSSASKRVQELAAKIVQGDYSADNGAAPIPDEYACEVMSELSSLMMELNKSKLAPVLHKPSYERFFNAGSN